MTRVQKQNLRAWLRQHRGGQRELARMLNIGAPGLSQWLQGRSHSARLDAEVPRLMELLQARIHGAVNIAPAAQAHGAVVREAGQAPAAAHSASGS